MIRVVQGNNVGAWTPWVTLTGGISGGSSGNTGGGGTGGNTGGGSTTVTPGEVAAPRLTRTGQYLTWVEVQNATGYQVALNGVLSSNSDLSLLIPYTPGKHTIMVRSLSGSNYSDWSSFTRTITDDFGAVPMLATPRLSLKGDSIVWDNNQRSGQSFIVSHNGKISFHTGDKLELKDLGLTAKALQGRGHTVMVQAVDGKTSSDWSEPYSNAARDLTLLIALSVGVVLVVGMATVILVMRKKSAKRG
jgi:hypothetical protein